MLAAAASPGEPCGHCFDARFAEADQKGNEQSVSRPHRSKAGGEGSYMRVTACNTGPGHPSQPPRMYASRRPRRASRTRLRTRSSSRRRRRRRCRPLRRSPPATPRTAGRRASTPTSAPLLVTRSVRWTSPCPLTVITISVPRGTKPTQSWVSKFTWSEIAAQHSDGAARHG